MSTGFLFNHIGGRIMIYSNSTTLIDHSKNILKRIENNIFSQAKETGCYTEYFASYIWKQQLSQTCSLLTRFLNLKRFSSQRLEAACRRSLFYGHYSYEMVLFILKNQLDSLPLDFNSDLYGQLFLDFND